MKRLVEQWKEVRATRIGTSRRSFSRTYLLAAAMAACTSLLGCHNRDGVVVKQVRWDCLRLKAGQALPRMKDADGRITDRYKGAVAVRFHLVDQPEQYLDLYQPGLCRFLEHQGTSIVPMTIGVTHSPAGRLLSFEQRSIPGRDLTDSERTRASFYLIVDEDAVNARDKIIGFSHEDDIFEGETLPSQRIPAEKVLQ